MDQYLYNYLVSGKSWLLIGSGPSIEMGYPTWEKLATLSIDTLKQEGYKIDASHLDNLLAKRNYPKIFSIVKQSLGEQRLRQVLRDNLKPTKSSSIYEIIAKWPIPVYLTTNYDNEIQNQLAHLRQAYSPLTNSEEHMGLLVPGYSNCVVKLHGDLSDTKGLILTEEDYHAVKESGTWEYWRIKLTSIFQMNMVIIIGYSLSDPNVKVVLEASKKGTGVTQPVIWIAPDVPTSKNREFLTEYRIRVISYDNRDGQHKNLGRLLKSISEAVPPRTAIRIREEVDNAAHPPEPNVAAAGFFVFNEFCKQRDSDERRIDIILSAIQASLPELQKKSKFDIDFVLETAGWVKNVTIDQNLKSMIASKAVERGILEKVGSDYMVSEGAIAISSDKRLDFERMRELFKTSLHLRIKKDFTELTDRQIDKLANDIESSLIRYFRDCGLSLASFLFSKGQQRVVPRSLFTFVASASTIYDDMTLRLAFFKTTIDCFVHMEKPEIDYLGRLSQGFFAFHSLGVFGDVAIERLKNARNTVWLIDSDTQIRLLALGCYGNAMFRDCIKRLKRLGLRFFTTSGLLSEIKVHLWFADNVVKMNGQNSPDIIASAKGESPYKKPNLFMEGFINWQAADNPCNWQSYLYSIFQQYNFIDIDVEHTLTNLGIEVIDLEVWPGFRSEDHAEISDFADQIVKKWKAISNRKQNMNPVKVLTHIKKRSQKQKLISLLVKKGRVFIIYY